MKLSISTSKDAIKDSGGSNFIGTEGVFDVTINFVSIATTSGGAKQADFNITYKGNTQVIYGPIVVNKDGNTNEIGMSTLNKLGVIVGLGEGDELTIVEETHKVGKDQKSQDFEVISEFSNQDIKLRVQREYSMNSNNGQIRRDLKIRNVFRADGASASEIANESAEVGGQLAIELEKFCSGPSYRDGVTAEQATAWETAQAAARSGSSTAAPTSTMAAKKGSMFAKKA